MFIFFKKKYRFTNLIYIPNIESRQVNNYGRELGRYVICALAACGYGVIKRYHDQFETAILVWCTHCGLIQLEAS